MTFVVVVCLALLLMQMRVIYKKMRDLSGGLMPGRVFAVVVDQGGAHEPDSVYSIWTTERSAIAEAKRLSAAKNIQRGCNVGVRVVRVGLDLPSDDNIDGFAPRQIDKLVFSEGQRLPVDHDDDDGADEVEVSFSYSPEAEETEDEDDGA